MVVSTPAVAGSASSFQVHLERLASEYKELADENAKLQRLLSRSTRLPEDVECEEQNTCIFQEEAVHGTQASTPNIVDGAANSDSANEKEEELPERLPDSGVGENQWLAEGRTTRMSTRWEAPEGLRANAAYKPVFADKEEMKKKLRAQLDAPPYNVHDFYWTEGYVQSIARNAVFENTTLGVIAFNAIWIAVDTDHNKAALLSDAHPVFQIAEHFFCVYFTAEILIRFLAFRRKQNCCRDSWFVFDSILVTFMVFRGAGEGDGTVLSCRTVRLDLSCQFTHSTERVLA